jgi:hypothetical protein
MTVSTEPRTAGRARRIVPLVVGTLVLLVLALPALLGGGALVAVHATERDGDGFYATGSKTLATPAHALVSDGLDVGTGGPDWLFREGRLGTVRVTATGTSSEPVFVGIARRSQVDAYLRGVARDLITDFEVDPFTVASTRRPGTATPAAPTGQGFWAGQASGAGRQTLSWPVQGATGPSSS